MGVVRGCGGGFGGSLAFEGAGEGERGCCFGGEGGGDGDGCWGGVCGGEEGGFEGCEFLEEGLEGLCAAGRGLVC